MELSLTDRTVLVTGGGSGIGKGVAAAVVAAGGVGINIIQIARAFGASQVIAVDVRDDKLEAARRLGATDVVNASSVDATARVRELPDGRGVDVAFEVLGQPHPAHQLVPAHPLLGHVEAEPHQKPRSTTGRSSGFTLTARSAGSSRS